MLPFHKAPVPTGFAMTVLSLALLANAALTQLSPVDSNTTAEVGLSTW